MALIGKSKKKLAPFLIFLFFVAITSFQFLHTEKSPKPEKNCPACHFQISSIIICSQAIIFIVNLLFVCFLRKNFFLHKQESSLFTPLSRSPPLPQE
ncbi:MAG: hypothetical protein DRJ06_00415 [Candidatus Aminicenantes bacterium]|nr:MAG: hypothetical protein DRJ06_00415 [Candidatus Aminicenantes bacterium]